MVSQVFQPLVRALEQTLDVMDEAWSVQTHSGRWKSGPYVQACYKAGEFMIEITSNRFLEPALGEAGVEQLKVLGWSLPAAGDFPNWYRVLTLESSFMQFAANLWVDSLEQCYLMDSTWEFQIMPLSGKIAAVWNAHLENLDTGLWRLWDPLRPVNHAVLQSEPSDEPWDVRLSSDGSLTISRWVPPTSKTPGWDETYTVNRSSLVRICKDLGLSGEGWLGQVAAGPLEVQAALIATAKKRAQELGTYFVWHEFED